ncbi:MAG: hypothetical protein FJ044_00875 [Candidatus Cloacimonetes bacterium]|nr:hypothetical protein [Candidatus Cloacimonadota bacterium]
MPPSNEAQQPNPDVFQEAGAHVETVLERAEVRNVREQKLLEVTRNYIERYQEVLYEHKPDGSIKRDENNQPLEKNSRTIKETLLQTGDRDSPEYDAYTALICSQILMERHQASLEAKQDAHGRDLEDAIRTFQKTKEESEILFGRGRVKAPEPADPRHPDLTSIETAQKAFTNNNERWRGGKTPLQTIEHAQELKGYQFPDRQSRAEIRRMVEYYHGYYYNLETEINNLRSEIVPQDDPRYASHQAEIQSLITEQNEIRNFLHATTDTDDIYRSYKVKEWVTGPEKLDPSTGKMVLDTEHLENLAKIQQAAAEFVSRRQAGILGEQQVAWRVLSDDEVSGLSDLEEMARIEQQYGKFEKIWVKEMGGDVEEIRNRVEWWGGLKAVEARVERELRTEMANLGVFGEVVDALLTAQTPEQVKAVKDKMEVFNLMAKELQELGLTEEQVRAALGIKLPEAAPPAEVAAGVAPTAVIEAPEAALEVEEGATYIPAEVLPEITRLLAEATRRIGKEKFNEQQQRLITAAQEGGGWYNLIAGQIGENEAKDFARRAAAVGARPDWSWFLGWFFGEILNLFTQR